MMGRRSRTKHLRKVCIELNRRGSWTPSEKRYFLHAIRAAVDRGVSGFTVLPPVRTNPPQRRMSTRPRRQPFLTTEEVMDLGLTWREIRAAEFDRQLHPKTRTFEGRPHTMYPSVEVEELLRRKQATAPRSYARTFTHY